MLPLTLQFIIAMIAGAINERLRRKLDYVEEERRILQERLDAVSGGKKISFTAEQRSVRNHLGQTWAADWFTIVTLRFQLLYGFIIVDLGRREVVRIGVTPTPSAQYAAQSFIEAVCDRDNEAPRFLIRDRDSIYGAEFRRRVKSCGTRCLVTPPRAPQANAFAERMIETLRRFCLDAVIVVDDYQAERVLREFVAYYHGRPHRGLRMQAPLGARWLPPIRRVPARAVRSKPVLGGLHHEYANAA